MQTKDFSAVHHDFARFLGSTLRRVENDFNSILSFPKCLFTCSPAAPKPATPLKDKYAESPLSKSVPAVKPRYSEPLPVFQEKRTVDVLPEAKPASREIGLRNIKFENIEEQAKAEVYFRDIQSASRTIRVAALTEIKKLSRPTVVALLEQLLAKEHDTLQLSEILNALASLGEESLISKKIFQNYVEHADAGIRLAALRAISKYSDEESFSILSSHMKDKDPEVRRQVLNCLCWTFGDRCLTFAINALHDSDSHVRKAACQITGALKAHHAISGLVTLLSDSETDIQASASTALKKITKEDFGFRATATKKNKEDAIEAWRFWWRENQTKFDRSQS